MYKYLLISLLLFSLSPTVSAATEQYQIAQTVTDKSKASLMLHTQIGLRTLLTQCSAVPVELPEHIDNNTLAAMVDRYEYERDEDSQAYTLTLQFNHAHTQALMAQNNIVPWKNNRPSTLVWLQNSTSPADITAAIALKQTLLPTIEQEAALRDLKILSPDYDLIDQQILSEEPQNFSLDLLRKKYAVDQILYGLVTQTAYDTQIIWNLFNSNENLTWHTENSSIQAGFQEATTYWVTQQKAQKTELQKTLSKIEVSGLSTLGDVDILSAQLTHNSDISHVEIKDINTNTFILELTHTGSTDELIDQLQQVAALQPNIESFDGITASSYLWIPATQSNSD